MNNNNKLKISIINIGKYLQKATKYPILMIF